MTQRFQRFLLILVSLIFLIASIFLILKNTKNNLIFFYTPTELLNSDIKINQKIRIGGFIQKKSLSKNKNNSINFIITDNKNLLNVSYVGILPDLFREGQGAVIEGVYLEGNSIEATKVFAKHDENYMPNSIKKELEKNDYWKKEY
jgi:cytochrome c-type biogenesis protein CcmE